jgi:hypothetical protein
MSKGKCTNTPNLLASHSLRYLFGRFPLCLLELLSYVYYLLAHHLQNTTLNFLPCQVMGRAAGRLLALERLKHGSELIAKLGCWRVG